MNKIKYIVLTAFLFVNHPGLFAQELLPDGVTVTASFLDEIKTNYNLENAFPFELNSDTLSVKIPIRVHIVRSINGQTGVIPISVYNSVNNANNYFKNIGINFFIDSIHIIEDYNYAYIANNRNTDELLTKFALDNRINLFLVDSVKKNYFRSYGFTYFPDVVDSNYIFLDKNYIFGNSLVTLLGHFMGLLSTHEFSGGRELVNQINCSSSGDYICDTYADPDLFEQVGNSCKYMGSAKDYTGNYYVPSVANIMSDALDKCKCVFTPLQYRRMYYYYLKYRQYLKY
jgi:hypothetical protein